nr:hypothetical transcript [Hymenolepis microstoma]
MRSICTSEEIRSPRLSSQHLNLNAQISNFSPSTHTHRIRPHSPLPSRHLFSLSNSPSVLLTSPPHTPPTLNTTCPSHIAIPTTTATTITSTTTSASFQ